MNTNESHIESERLQIQAISSKYTEDIFKEFTPEITTLMFPKPADDIQETIDFINESVKNNSEGKEFVVVLLDKETGEFLGAGGLHHIDKPNPEFGIWLKKSAHGKGYGKEAISALKKWADQNLDYESLIYPVDKDNIPSRKIPEAMGGISAREYQEISQTGKTLNLIEFHIYPEK